MVPENGQLDTTIEIVTPENIAFSYRLAGPFRRLPAYLIDLAIRIAVCAVGGFFLGLASLLISLPSIGGGMALVLWFVMAWFYGGLFETFWNGQTPGKRAMAIRVLSVEGQPINALQAVLRNILRTVDAQPAFLYQVGLIAASMNNRFQRLGDLVCGTIVVIEERRRLEGVVQVADPEVVALAGQIPPTFQPSRALTHALALYVGRRTRFPWTRRMEIARHLAEPLRLRWEMPEGTNPDLLLRGLYYRTFVTDRAAAPLPEAGSPFAAEDSTPEANPFNAADREPSTGESSEDDDSVAAVSEGGRP